MIKQSRRQFLKSAGCSALALALAGANAGLASAATLSLPADSKTVQTINQSLRFLRSDRDIMLYLQQSVGEERMTLINNNPYPIRLDSKQPLQLKNINGSLVVKLKQSASGTHVLSSGDVLILDIKTDNHKVRISSAHPTFRKHFSMIA